MRKIIILSSVLLVAIAVIAVKYFSELSGVSNNSAKVLKYIPSDAALVMSFTNDESFYDIVSNYEPFDAILGEQRSAELTRIHTLLLEQPGIKELTDHSKIFLSLHHSKTDSVDFLFTIGLNERIQEQKFMADLHSITAVSLKKLAGENIYEAHFDNSPFPFYLFIRGDVAAGSFSEKLIRHAIDEETPKIPDDFVTEIDEKSARNHNSPVTLFINHGTLPSFAKSFMRGALDGNSALIQKMKGFSSLSMNFKSDALMFNGISTPDTTSPAYLDLFLTQRPVKNQLKSLLPENTANSVLFGFSNYNVFHNKLSSFLDKKGQLKKIKAQLMLIKAQTGVDLDKDLRPVFSTEIAVLETKEREKFGIIKLTNGTRANSTLQLISDRITENTGHLNHSNLFYYYFGEPFKNFSRPYFGIIDNYLIISNSLPGLQRYLSDYSSGRFISKTKEYQDHDQLVANKSNILYFVNSANSEQIIKRVLRRGFSEAFFNKNYGLANFYGLSWQWSSEGSHFQVNLYSNYLSNGKKELKPVWTFKMNARIGATLQVVKNGSKNMILVQDYVNNLYALSTDGVKIWADQLDGKLEGPVTQLRDGSLLFNSSRKLYRIDIKGNSFPGFPVNLPYSATAGLSLSSPKPDEARAFIPAGNMLLAYDMNGKTVEGWNKQLPGKILADVKLIAADNINYVIAGTKTGEFFFFNNEGRTVGKAKIKRVTLFKNPLFTMKTDEGKINIVTADTAGIVCHIGLDGVITEQVIAASAATDFAFELANVAGDEQPELIYLDKQQLNVYNNDGSLAFMYNFEQQADLPPQLFSLKKNEYIVGISSKTGAMQFLLDSEGSLMKGFPLKGDGVFYAGYLKNDGIRYVINGTNNVLQAYKL